LCRGGDLQLSGGRLQLLGLLTGRLAGVCALTDEGRTRPVRSLGIPAASRSKPGLGTELVRRATPDSRVELEGPTANAPAMWVRRNDEVR